MINIPFLDFGNAKQAAQTLRFYADENACTMQSFMDRVFEEVLSADDVLVYGSEVSPLFNVVADDLSSTEVRQVLAQWAAQGGAETPAQFKRWVGKTLAMRSSCLAEPFEDKGKVGGKL